MISILTNKELRDEVCLLRRNKIKYSEIAGYLEISQSSFYNWLNECYDFGKEKQAKL